MALPAYALTVEIQRPFHAAVAALREALEAEGMRCISEADPWCVQQPLASATAGPRQWWIGVCSPAMADAVWHHEPDLGALLPCGVHARELAPGHTRVCLQDPSTLATHARHVAVQQACRSAQHALRRVVERLMLAAP